jgi:integrase
MSDDQLQVLFQRMDNYRSTYGDIKHYVTMCVMLFTGARISAALTAKNYKLTKDELSFFIVRQKSRTVEDIEKSIPLDIVMPNGQTFKDIAQQYIRLREQRSVRNAYLFPGTGSEPASQGGLRGYISKLNLPYKFTPHALRHTAGTMMAERVGVLEATRLLDHSSINITQKYIKRNTSNSHDSIRQVWAKQSAPNNPDLATTQSPELQAVIEKFQKDAQRLSDMVARLSS